MAHSFAILIRRILWIAVGISLVFFAVNNRQVIEISLEPLPFSIPVPVWGVLFAGIFIGLFVSALVTGWIRLQGFAKRRKAERRAASLDTQMTAMAEDAHKAEAANAHKTVTTGTLAKGA